MSLFAKVTLKNGDTKRFTGTRERPIQVTYAGVFVIITDGYGEETAFPAADVAEVKKDAPPRSF